MKIFETNKAGTKKHFHILYANEQTGEVIVTKGDDGHEHELIRTPDGKVLLGVAADGHTHEEIKEYEDSYPSRPEVDEDEVVQNCLGLAKVAYEDAAESISLGYESEEFYLGKQWDDSTKSELENDGRACLVINYTQKNIDSFVGYQRQQRADTVFLPNENSDQIACDVANTVYKIIMGQNNFEFEESAVFEDIAIPGRGNFNLWMDFDEDPRGDVKVERFPWDGVLWGPHQKLDGSDAEYVVKYQYQSIRKMKSQWPKKADEFEDWLGDVSRNPGMFDATPHTSYQTDQYMEGQGGTTPVSSILAEGFNLVDVAKKEICVMEVQQKIYMPCVVVYDSMTEEASYFYGMSATHQKLLKQIPNLAIIPRTQKKIRLTKLAGGVLLEDNYPAELAIDDFHVVPVYGKKRRNRFWGRVEIGKDPQRETNKRLSQSIDIVNFAALYGFVIDDGTFPNKAEENNFREQSTTPGFVAKVTDSNNPPKLIQGIKFPSEVMGMADASEQRLERLQGLEATRFAGANTSSAAIMQAEKSGLVSSEGYFDNLSLSKKKVAKIIIAMIQKYYSPARIMRMIQGEASRTDVQLAGQPYDQYDPMKIEQILENTDLTKLDISMGETAWSPTQKMATAQALTELMGQGAPIPPEIVFETMNMPDSIKKKLVAGSMQQQQAASQEGQTTYDMEIQKSLIGQGIITDEVKQKYGIGQSRPEGLATQPAEGQNNLPEGLYGNSPTGL